MSIQVWTPYTADRSTLAGGQALAAGIGGGLNSLGDALGKAMEAKKNRGIQAKASEQLFKSTPELQEALQMDPDDFSALSAADKIELVKTGVGKISLLQSLQAQKAQAQEMEMRQMQSAAESQSLADSMGFNREVAGMTQAQTGQPVDLQQVLGAGARHNQLGNPQFDNLLNSLQRGQLGADSFIEDPMTGARFLASGNTRLPSGGNPEKMTSVTVTDPNTGEMVELPINPRTGQPMLKPRSPQNAPRVSPDFTKSLGELAIGLDDPKNGPRVRTGIKAMIDSAHTLKQLDDSQRDGLYQQFGIGGKAGAATAPAGDRELQLANEAIKAGVDRKKVAARYKERTGRELP